jgi:hypothetical protein
MSHPRPRSGIFATVNGFEYEADSYPENGRVTLFSRAAENPDAALFQRDATTDAWLATIETSRCDRLVEVTTRADYRGLLCQVVDIAPDGATGLYYLGDEKARAAETGFVQIDPGTWAKTVHVHDLQSYREHHADLLFDEWKSAAVPTGGDPQR